MEIADELKEIDEKLINELHQITKDQVEYWDIRASVNLGTNLDFTDQRSKEVSSYKITDCGIRTFINGGWGFCVLKDLNRVTIKNGFQKAIKLAKLSESLSKYKFKIIEQDPMIQHFKINSKKDLEEIDIGEKIKLVIDHEKIASQYSPKIKNTHTLYLDAHTQNIFLNSFNSNIFQDLSFLRLFSLAYAQENGILQRSINSVAGVGGYEITETEKAKTLSSKTAKEAVELLKAKSPIGGKFTIIMDPILTGTFVHESFGHAVEADHILNKESILEGRLGEKIAIEEVNIIDNPTMSQSKKFNLPYELFGCYFIDDEGIPSQKTIIVEKGILKNYLHSLETSSRMNELPNGHGRASSSSSRPQVRMGFTYLEPQDWSLEEMIEEVKDGILCEDFQYGYTDPTTGNFQFKCKLSHQIVNGEKKQLMRDVALSGMTLEILNKITAIGDQNTYNYSDGLCGKGGQSVRVCDGGPYIRIENVTVGGLN
ncbi:MAG: TldD/PmbA family protein [Promethearchaeota archaeon]|nr:MAG: TldD/PmbA family protein [Candidatus Lokiarchaeota archaeon]